MMYTKDFSVIVPVWRGAIKFLPKLFDSIPEKEGIEIIVVDNSKEPVKREEIESSREIIFLHSAPERHAGGSRNDGMAAAKGKWLIFADADDFFAPNAFDIFYSHYDTDAEIVYTGMGGVYADTGEYAERGEYYKKKVHDFCEGLIDENSLRLEFPSPCCKMVSHTLVDREGLKYDEIRAGNDRYFSIASGYYAKKIDAEDVVTYIATVNKGSLTRRKDYEVTKSRLYSMLHCNQFLRLHRLGNYQQSIMFALAESRHYEIRKMWEFVRMVMKFRQNPFIGMTRWVGSARKLREKNKKEGDYIVR